MSDELSDDCNNYVQEQEVAYKAINKKKSTVRYSSRKNKKPSILRVIRSNGTILECETSAETFCTAIIEIGVENVFALHIPSIGI